MLSVKHPSADHSESDQQLIGYAKQFLKLNGDIGNAPVTPANASADDDLVDKQSKIIEQALKIDATNVHGVLAKMSIWAADAPDLSDQEHLSRYDAILLSAFADLVKLCSADDG